MKSAQPKPSSPNTLIQLLITFVIPIIILTYLSAESRLGPVRGFLAVLALPIIYEAYGLLRHRKPSLLSLLAIGGILVTGTISVLRLNEDWLAVRRALPYLAVALVFLASELFKLPVFKLLLPHVLDMEKVRAKARQHKALPNLDLAIQRAGYLVSTLLVLITVATFVMTKVVITSATDTTAFNQEYAQLRLLSIPIVTLPLVVGITLVLYYLVSSIEKFTGLAFDDILKKKPK